MTKKKVTITWSNWQESAVEFDVEKGQEFRYNVPSGPAEPYIFEVGAHNVPTKDWVRIKTYLVSGSSVHGITIETVDDDRKLEAVA